MKNRITRIEYVSSLLDLSCKASLGTFVVLLEFGPWLMGGILLLLRVANVLQKIQIFLHKTFPPKFG